jgi:DNA-binding response OmpR family regulator
VKILLLEDKKIGEKSLYKTLSRKINYVDVIGNENDALLFLHDNLYDILVINASRVRGNMSLSLQNMRRKPVSVPVLCVEYSGSAEVRALILDAGADDCISSPFDEGELISRVRALGRRIFVYSDDNITVGDMVLNRKLRELTKDGASVSLGGKVYEMMEMFALNQKQIISKAKFADKIWGYDSEAEYNNIEVYVSFLRRKLRELRSEVRISSVRGVGYCLKWSDNKVIDK